MFEMPYYFDKISTKNAMFTPNAIKNVDNNAYWFWCRALIQRAASIFDFSFPDHWRGTTKDFIVFFLFYNGYVVFGKDEAHGLYAQPCNIKGYDFYYQPTEAIITNPALKRNESITLKLGVDGELLKLTPDYLGVWDIISYYAIKLALLDSAINMSLINSKFSFILGAKTKGAVQTLKKILDKVNRGEPAVFFDSRILDDTLSKDSPFQHLDLGNPKDRYLTTEQLQDFATIIRQFDTEIGIPTIPYEKKERMVQSEAESKEIESVARCTVWLNTMTESFKDINELFGSNMSVKLRFGGEGNVSYNDGYVPLSEE